MTVFSTVVQSVERGQKVKINLKQKSLALNRKMLIENGKNLTDMELINEDDLVSCGVFGADYYGIVEYFYHIFQHSVPSENSCCNKPYFKALPYEELSDEDMIYGVQRDTAQVILEMYVLLGSLKGWLTWKDDSKWFWQSEKYPSLVILRGYIKKG